MVELYPHQKTALAKMHNGCILVGDVGLGKSLVAVAYYMEKEAPKDVIVITTAKKRDTLDWDADFARYGVGKVRDFSTQGVLIVDSWNNLQNYRDRTECFFIFDEQRVVGSGRWTKDFLHVTRGNQWIMLSATPGDVWLDYVPVFIANGFYKNRSEFLQTHVIYNRFSKFPKVERYVGVSRLLRLRDSVLVPMPYERHTTREVTFVPVEYSREDFDLVLKRRWHLYESRPLRDVAELFSVMRKVVNSSPDKMVQLRSLIAKHPKLIVFYNFDYELMELRTLAASGVTLVETQSVTNDLRDEECLTNLMTGEPKTSPKNSDRFASERSKRSKESLGSVVTENGFPSSLSIDTSTPSHGNSEDSGGDFQVAEWNGHKHQPIPDTERWVYLVQYVAGSEGWNCIETDAMVFYSLTYSYKNWHQAYGRIDRLNTPFNILHYYVLMTDSVIDKAILRSLKDKKSFNESRFLKQL